VPGRPEIAHAAAEARHLGKVRLPSMRSAWPSIQPSIASRSWLAVSFMATRTSAWLEQVVVDDGRPLRDEPGMNPRTRPRRTISSMRPSSAYASGRGCSGTQRSASSSTRCCGSLLAR